MLPVNCGSHADYQNFVVTNLRKYYPDPSALARSTWDIIERFWNLDLSFTDTFMADKYSKFGPAPRTPSSIQRSYLLSIDFKVTSITEWAAQLKIKVKKPKTKGTKADSVEKVTVAELEDGRHRSTKMWYCRLYHILMLQHLDAWNLPSESTLKKMILDVA